MTTQHIESPATKTPAPELTAPDTAPPSPPPSRGPSRQRASKCAALEDPFVDPPVSREGSGDPRQESSSTENPFFSDDEDEPQQGKGKGKGKESEETRWRRCLRERNLTLTLENSGSVARDHLASERTFLAYVRTSLTMSSAGVGLIQLFSLSASSAHREDLQHLARPLGSVMVAIGLFTLGIGVVRYFLVQDALVRGVYPVARVSTTALSFFVLAIVIAVFVVVLVRT
ncbi:hypothetical protein C2E23DRAFT_887665 [Lenzites betulinus]|nr:hypothetical protein C2E23DRAFT_887665 [Lenzites betulinus]